MSVHTTSREARPDRRRAQAKTATQATRWAEPWTPTEDRELLLGEGTIAQRAARLGRTFYASQVRLTYLRRQGAERRSELVAK